MRHPKAPFNTEEEARRWFYNILVETPNEDFDIFKIKRPSFDDLKDIDVCDGLFDIILEQDFDFDNMAYRGFLIDARYLLCAEYHKNIDVPFKIFDVEEAGETNDLTKYKIKTNCRKYDIYGEFCISKKHDGSTVLNVWHIYHPEIEDEQFKIELIIKVREFIQDNKPGLLDRFILAYLKQFLPIKAHFRFCPR